MEQEKNTRLWELPHRFLYASAWEHLERWNGHEGSHPTCEFAFVLEGTLRMVLDGTYDVALSTGDLLFLPGGVHHTEKMLTDRLVRKYLVFEMEPPTANGFAPDLLRPMSTREFMSDFIFLFDTIYEEQDHARWGGRQRVLMCFQQFLLLFCRLVQEPKRSPEREALSPKQAAIVRSATEDFDKTLGCRDQISTVATRYSLTPAYFSTLFRSQHGIPPSQYVKRRGIEHARDLLTHSDNALAEIAEQLGFYDAGHFSRQFRQATGMTPSTFRVRSKDRQHLGQPQFDKNS